MNNKSFFYLQLTILGLVCLSISCQKDKAEDDLSNNDENTEYFPNSVNTQWKYERYDSLKSLLDTITVRIISDTVISDDVYMIWEYDYNIEKERFYISTQADSIKFYSSINNPIDQLYLIPFNINDGWINPEYYSDTSFVLEIQDITIDNITYSDVVLIVRSAFGFNNYLTEKIWIKPYFGLIKLERKHIILGPYKDETWEIIESKIE